MQKKSSGAGCNGGGRTRTAEAYIGAYRSRSGNGDAGSGKVGLDFTKPGKAATGFRGKTVVCCLIRGGRKNRNRGRRCRQCRVRIRFQKCHIGGGKSGDREPDVEIRRRWKSAVNLKRPDTGGRIQHADQNELAAGRALDHFVVDVDHGALQNEGDPLFLIQRDGNPRNRLAAGRAETDRKKLWSLSPEFQGETAVSFRNEKLYIFRGVSFGYRAIIMV